MRSSIAAALCLVLAGCAAAAPTLPGPVVSPGQVFPGDTLTLKWPDAQGWHLTQSQANEWVFTKLGAEPDERYIAAISWVNLPAEITSVQEFVAFVKQGADAQFDPKRFRNLQAGVDYSDARKYPCVTYRATALDAQPPSQAAGALPQRFELENLVCQNPILGNKAFIASFSHRGSKPDPQFRAEASDFFAGVQVPGR